MTIQYVTLPITGLDCMDCAAKLEQSVAKMDGMRSAKLNFATSALSAEYDTELADLDDIVARVREMGYQVAVGDELLFDLEGLDCADCAAKLQQAVSNLPGILGAQVIFATATLRARGSAGADLEQAIVQQAQALGYRAHPHTATAPKVVQGKRDWRALWNEQRHTILTIASGTCLALGVFSRALGTASWAPTLLYALSILLGGFYVARSGWGALRTTHSLDMNALMSIAAVGAMTIGEWAEGATAMFLFSLGNTLEAWSMDRARQSIRKLVELAPREATRIHGEHADRVPVEQLQVGDLIEIRPGERVPMDGQVEKGSSALNQAPITGESTPVEVVQGSPIYAGSINGQGALLVRVTKLARDNTISRIVQMVQEAQGHRAPSQRFVDTFAKYYTPAVIALAIAIATLAPLLLHASFAVWFYRALVLLVISCPCALVISTPVAIVSAISNAARHGVLVKGGVHLEDIARVRAVAFDKTGTLTEGRPAVIDVLPLEDTDSAPPRTPDQLLALAASLEAHSQHPIARAIYDEAKRRGLSLLAVADSQELTGHGTQAHLDGHTYYIGNHQLFSERVVHANSVCQQVEQFEAQGKTAVLIGNEQSVLGLITVADRVRDASSGVVHALQALGISETVLLSGDNERTAQAIGQQCGITNVQAGLLPQDKVQAIEKLLSASGKVAMLGDGVNDAPALARASVGIAMGAAGSDAALETADIVLMSDDLWRVPYVIRLGRRTLQRIRENVVLSLAIKGVFLLLAVSGLATLWMAVFADMGTSLIVTFNGMRLLRENQLEK